MSIGGFNTDDGIIQEGNLVIVPESPFEISQLSSIFVTALPCSYVNLTISNVISQAFIHFDLRLADFIEIGGWVNHSSAYQVLSFEELPT